MRRARCPREPASIPTSRSLSPHCSPNSEPMSRLRSLLFTLFQLCFTPPYAVLVCAVFFLPPRQRFWVIKQWCSANLWAARVLCGIRYRVIGTENIPAATHLILCKHSSTFETLALNEI